MTNSSGRPIELTKEDVLQTFSESQSFILTSNRIAEKHDCTPKTARKRLNALVEDDTLRRYELESKQNLYFRTGYEVAEKITQALNEHLDLDDVDHDQVAAFAANPYKVLPKDDDEYYVLVPRFVPFHLGHLHDVDEAWNTFIINKYSIWITDLPESIRDQIEFEQQYDDLRVRDGRIELSNPDDQQQVWDDLSGHDGGLRSKPDDDSIQIKQNCEIDVIAALVDRGHLPFERQPIDEETLRDDSGSISLREYQEQAWKQFCETGQIGVYWPPSAGKTYLSLYAGNRVPGSKLVVVPDKTLEKQWRDEICERALEPTEWDVRTYQFLAQNGNIGNYQDENAPALTIFDECHTLPADSFSKLATLDTTYRIGLSASPYREDGRTDYIFSLTGFPVGVDWQELVKEGVITFPSVYGYLYETPQQKRKDLIELTEEKRGKGIVFCDSLEEGSSVADEIGVPFISGETTQSERIEAIEDNDVVVVSRIADEGLSLDDLSWTIEFDFHGGSRRQELQRAGRTMHSHHKSQHIVQMTDEEREKYGERLYGLEEQGMEVQYVRRA